MAIQVRRGMRVAEGKGIEHLHPEAVARLAAMFADAEKRFGWKLYAYSIVRSEAHQRQLYAGYLSRIAEKKAGRRRTAAPIVANPDRVNSMGRHGSAHMAQPRSYQHGDLRPLAGVGYAVDVRHTSGRKISWEEVKILDGDLLPKWGLRRSVPSEVWHFVPMYDFGRSIGMWGIGDKGTKIADIQRFLNEELDEIASLAVDGDYGPATARVVELWQNEEELTVNGEWSVRDQARMNRELAADRDARQAKIEARRARRAAKERRRDRRTNTTTTAEDGPARGQTSDLSTAAIGQIDDAMETLENAKETIKRIRRT